MATRRLTQKNQGQSITYGNDSSIINVNNDISNPLFVKLPPSSGADNIYINISVLGENTGNPSQPHKTFTFQTRFPEPIISNIENYYLSIVSLAFSITEVPLHIIDNIQPGIAQSNPNLTDWSFCFTYNNVDYQSFVQYVPYNAMVIPPAPSQNSPSYSQVYTNYYFVDNYLVLVKMFNTTLQSIYAAMYSANVVAFTGLGLTANDYPYMIYDDTTEKFRFIYNKLFIGNGIDLYFSDTFNVVFPGFFTYYYGTALANGKDYKLIFENEPTNGYDTTHNANSQMYSGSPSNLNTINQIVVSSNTMRSSFEIVTTDTNQGSNSFGYSNVIFSLLPDLDTPKASKGRLVYVTSGQYRLIDIISTGPLTQIDFNVYYTDQNGNIFPISIPEGMVANAKLIFMKKSLKNFAY